MRHKQENGQQKINFFTQFYYVLILIVLGYLIYSNTFASSFQLDDQSIILENDLIKNLSRFLASWKFGYTRYFSYLTFALNYHFHQLDVFGYHLVNLVVHLLSTLFVWQFTLLTFDTPVLKKDKITQHKEKIAFFVALVFLAHPLQTQAVTYIVQRLTSLATLFYLASMFFYVKSRLVREKRMQKRGIFFILFVFIAILGFYSKEITFTLPIMIVLYEFFFLQKKNKKFLRKELLLLVPLLLVLFAFVLLTFQPAVVFAPKKSYLGEDITSYNYLLTQFRVLVVYLRLLFLPIHQVVDYYFPISTSLWEFNTLLGLGLLSSIGILAWKLFKKYRLLSFSIAWFFLTLSIESSIIPIKDVIFEHRLYLPMFGFALFTVSGFYYLLIYLNQRLKNNKTKSEAWESNLTILILAWVAMLSILSYERNKIWQTEISFWEDNAAKAPLKVRPFYNLGNSYSNAGKLAEAQTAYERVLRMKPDHLDARNNLAVVLADQDRMPEAILHLEEVLKMKPDHEEARNNLIKLMEMIED